MVPLRRSAALALAALAISSAAPAWAEPLAQQEPAEATLAAARPLVWQAEFSGTLGPDIARRDDPCAPRSNFWFASSGELVTRMTAGTDPCLYHRVALTTEGRRTFGLGRFAVRAKLSTAPGAHNGSFMVGAVGEWPAAGEINLNETTGNSPHTHFRLWSARVDDPDARCGIPVDVDLPYGWHTYFVERGPGWATIGADGQVYARYTRAQYAEAGCTWPFDGEFFVNINQSGGGYGGTIETLPIRSRFDWMRYYR